MPLMVANTLVKVNAHEVGRTGTSMPNRRDLTFPQVEGWNSSFSNNIHLISPKGCHLQVNGYFLCRPCGGTSADIVTGHIAVILVVILSLSSIMSYSRYCWA